MKILGVVFCCFISLIGSSQLSLFKQLCRDSLVTQDYTYEILMKSTGFELYPEQSSVDQIASIFAHDLMSIGSQKTQLNFSKMLQQMSGFACESWKGSNYKDKDKWSKLDKQFRRAKRRTTAGFTVVKCISFRINLTESKQEKVYYDEENGDGKFNLFYGIRLTKKEIDEGKIAQPVSQVSLKDLQKQLQKNIKSRKIYADLRKGVYSSIGISVVLDKRTVEKNTLPTARVVLFLGSKRLQQLKINE